MWLEIHTTTGQVVIDNLTSEGRQHILFLCKQLITELEEADYNERLDELLEEELEDFVRCRQCGCYIKLAFGADAPAAHHDASGTCDDPRAPGDHDDICANCDYG